MDAGNPGPDAALRRQAEQLLAARSQCTQDNAAGTQRWIYELQVHQIELELQNAELRQTQAELESLLRRYADLYDGAPVGYLTVSAGGTIHEANLTAARLLGRSQIELSLQRFDALICDADLPRWHKAISVPANGQAQRLEMQLRQPDGSSLQAQLDWLPAAADGPDATIRIALTDISERKRTEAQMRTSASVFLHSYNGIMMVDVAGRIIDVNPAFTRITGYSQAEVIGQPPHLLSSGRHEPEFYAAMWTSLHEHDHWQGEIWNRHKSGRIYAERLAISVIRDESGALQQYIGIFSDITASKLHEAELDRIAHFDSLTGIPNRRLLADRLERAIGHARRNNRMLAVCYLDLDGFKPINDQFGHGVGDELLVEITRRLQDQLRDEDTIARIGGDEFVLLLSDLDNPEEAQTTLQRLLDVVAAPVSVLNRALSVSASIGVTLYPDDEVDAEPLLRHADQAMYRAKQAGKNRYCLFDPKHDREMQAQRTRLKRLREALVNQEFVLFYQPKVDLVSGEVIGAEALIRWQHPEHGLLAPGDFLGHVMGTELDAQLGEWVIATVLAQIAGWQAEGLCLTVSANISAEHLLQPDFADRLSAALACHAQLSPHALELEILETAALADMGHAEQVLNRCHALGVRFALDDFGTGYSSLTYFRKLPIDMLKIDRSFVTDMLVNLDDRHIVDIVVRLARGFGCGVIAEGVETLAHGKALLELGCRLAQGYGVARPMPAAAFAPWVAAWQTDPSWRTLVDPCRGQTAAGN